MYTSTFATTLILLATLAKAVPTNNRYLAAVGSPESNDDLVDTSQAQPTPLFGAGDEGLQNEIDTDNANPNVKRAVRTFIRPGTTIYRGTTPGAVLSVTVRGTRTFYRWINPTTPAGTTSTSLATSTTTTTVPTTTTTTRSTTTTTRSTTTTTRSTTSSSSSASSSPTPGPVTGPIAGSAFANLALSSHNEARARHGAEPLVWSQTLSNAAQTWANRCVFEHSRGALGRYGENLAATAGFDSNIKDNAVKPWMDEAPDYNPANPTYSHFTQVVWKATREVGCAVAQCNNIFDPQYPNQRYFVCEYSPPGNSGGPDQYRLNVQP